MYLTTVTSAGTCHCGTAAGSEGAVYAAEVVSQAPHNQLSCTPYLHRCNQKALVRRYLEQLSLPIKAASIEISPLGTHRPSAMKCAHHAVINALHMNLQLYTDACELLNKVHAMLISVNSRGAGEQPACRSKQLNFLACPTFDKCLLNDLHCPLQPRPIALCGSGRHRKVDEPTQDQGQASV